MTGSVNTNQLTFPYKLLQFVQTMLAKRFDHNDTTNLCLQFGPNYRTSY